MYYYNNYNIIILYIYLFLKYLSYILSMQTVRSPIHIYCHAISDIKVIFHHTRINSLAFEIESPKHSRWPQFSGYVIHKIFFKLVSLSIFNGYPKFQPFIPSRSTQNIIVV